MLRVEGARRAVSGWDTQNGAAAGDGDRHDGEEVGAEDAPERWEQSSWIGYAEREEEKLSSED